MERDERNERDEARQQLPFEGLHVYQRVQEAWNVARALAGVDPRDAGALQAGGLQALVEEEIRRATLGIARATARSRSNGHFGAELEAARGALHAAAAALDQLHRSRSGEPEELELRTLLADSSRMLGALIRSVANSRGDDSRAGQARVSEEALA